MTTPQQKLASSLEALKALQDKGLQAIPGTALNRAHRQTLQRAGFLQQVIRGWYIAKRPDETDGDTTPWYASMREFVAGYSNERFGDRWHLNPEQSILLRSGERSVPKQLQIWATEGTNQTVELLHGSSLFIYRAPQLLASSPVLDCGGLRLAELPQALVAASPNLFVQNPMAIQVALYSLSDASDLSRLLLAGPHPAVAGRIAGAFRAAGRPAFADEILGAMRSAGNVVNELNPFTAPLPTLLPGGRAEAPYVQRLRLLWAAMREPIIQAFPASQDKPTDTEALLKEVEARYVSDAYHSLSIEGYRVTADLIEKIRNGNWNPDANAADQANRDAMAAKGYFETHKIVKEDLVRIVKGENPGTVFRQSLSRWYQALFSPSVQAGIVKPADLAGFRNDQVFIRGAQHVPPSKDAVRECMPVLFELLEAEAVPAVRAVLGHFVFVYIHPYMDGNGRIARFLMNLMLASSGYVWTVIPVDQRTEYMKALERASSSGDIAPFAALISRLTNEQQRAPLPRPR